MTTATDLCKVISYIPDMPEDWDGVTAPWRDALGYCWQDGGARIPGDDRRWLGADNYDEVMADVRGELEREHGPGLIFARKTPGSPWHTDTEEHGELTVDQVRDLTAVALLVGMWPGGFDVKVYMGTIPARKVAPKPPELMLNPKYAHLSSVELSRLRIEYDAVNNEGGYGFNPYRDAEWVEVSGDSGKAA